jgi:cold shock CspA family protein
MLMPPQVTFRGIKHSPELEAAVLDRVSWLEQFYQGIVSCRVLIEAPHRHRRDGRHFHLTIELTVPNSEPIVVSHAPSMHGPLKDTGAGEHLKASETDSVHRYARVTIHDAFDVARRRLQDFARRQRGAVKLHQTPAHGVVSVLMPDEGYGFIEADERQIYFNRASVLDTAFDELSIGKPVAFIEEKGDKGPQASSVRVLGKHHYMSK